MEFIDNGTIKDLMMKHGDGLPELCVYYLFNQLVGGLEDMHNQKIIHRDIKPDKIGLISNFDIKIFFCVFSNKYCFGACLRLLG